VHKHSLVGSQGRCPGAGGERALAGAGQERTGPQRQRGAHRVVLAGMRPTALLARLRRLDGECAR